MKIALLTLGTRGDVQPYAVLGRALKQRGHEVKLSTGHNFASMAEEYQIGFSPVNADFHALINSDEGKALMKNPFLARRHFKTIVQPMMIEAMQGFYHLAKDSDCVLYHVKALGDYFADEFPGKMIRANVVPAIQPTSEFPNPVFSGLSLPSFLNRLTYKLSDLGLAMMNGAIRQFRSREKLSLRIPKVSKLPSIYGISPHFLPTPADYPMDSYYTGFWYDQSPSDLSPDVLEFVAQRSTVLITFGSMSFETKVNLPLALSKIAQQLDINILVVKGWGFNQQSPNFTDNHIKFIEGAPYEKLFPKVRAVVHHGGIGTLAECLRAGIPSLSCPVIYPMGDQHFWGNRAYALGCAPRPIPLKQLTEGMLMSSVRELLSSESMSKRSMQLANLLKSENGPTAAAEIIERHFDRTKKKP